ncbi:MAG: GTPase HflX [Planctomycetota bacterium]|nr:MAG: GTPase HflX [Planctomycetota bacterium]
MKPEPESTRRPAERAIAAALVLPGSAAAAASDPLDEITGLATAAGAVVVDGVTQRLRVPDSHSAFGRGKVAEMRALAQQHRADLVVVDHDLSPSQGRNLEKDLGVRVVDRTELILDIFARRARTRQAMLQVELAQMEYLRPRLRRMWTHLERTEGAIGTRGPGETQLETDRRLISRKISELRRKLKEIEARAERQAESRDEPVTVSLVGYTNVGKSSLMRCLTGAQVLVADQLFATLDTRVRRWPLRDGRAVLLTDTVGFVRELPHHLVASFHATLAETLRADLLLHVCDAADPDLDLHLRAVEAVLAQLRADAIPRVLLLNKMDQVPREERGVLLDRHPEAVAVSAHSGEGLDALDAAVAAWLDAWSLRLELTVPMSQGKLLAELRRTAMVESEDFEDERWRGRVRILPRRWNGLASDWQRAGGSFRALA